MCIRDRPYVGPGNPSPTVGHQYTFLLFEQSEEIGLDPSSSYGLRLASRSEFNVTELVETLSLTSIRGVNWVWAYNDEFANVELQAFGLLAELPCAESTTDAPLSLAQVSDYASSNEVGFLQPGDLDYLMNLTTLLSVSYEQPAGDLDYCGETLSLSAASFQLVPEDTLGEPTETPWDLRSARSDLSLIHI